ncbi:MAG: molybdate ABC transporter substrate-binding protein [Caldilinea sp.]|nr:molybdate ABC transporter substrate-binding protein [Caldilinea sp.]MDW8440700.1 molybdate ABC transporter substrate-binding protein [Caldilineaceae bacterium]
MLRLKSGSRIHQIFTLIWVVMALWGAAACTERSAASSVQNPSPIIVAAAADLQFAFTEIAELFEQRTGQPVTLVFGSSGQLAQQIENGAPFDLFASANITFIEQLLDKGLILPDTVAPYGEGRIVLAVNRNVNLELTDLQDLETPLIQRIAIANPEHAPYGLAAKEALLATGVWENVEPKLVYGENVRQALQFVQTGDAQAGIVALSIANVPEIRWTLIDANLHNPLLQALAVVKSTSQPEVARAFAAFVNGEEGRAIMRRYGFVMPGEMPD